MNPFEHVEIIQHSKQDRVYAPCLKLEIDIKTIPKFESEIARIAWLKYILDNGKITKVSRLCNRCRRTLLDNEEYCSLCNSKNSKISESACMDILITNIKQIEDIPISIFNMGATNYYALMNRFMILFPKEYLNIFAANGKNIVTYPSFTDFPDVDDTETVDLLGTIFVDESTGYTYILDFGDIYEAPEDFYSVSAMYNTMGYRYGLNYIKTKPENFRYILERFIYWNDEKWQNKE